MKRAMDILRRLWREYVVGPRLRTYDVACEELGGPWRPSPDATDRWFVGHPPEPPLESRPLLDSTFIALAPRLPISTKLLLGGALLSLLGLVLLAASGGTVGKPPDRVKVASPLVAPPRPAPVAPAAQQASPVLSFAPELIVRHHHKLPPRRRALHRHSRHERGATFLARTKRPL